MASFFNFFHGMPMILAVLIVFAALCAALAVGLTMAWLLTRKPRRLSRGKIVKKAHDTSLLPSEISNDTPIEARREALLKFFVSDRFVDKLMPLIDTHLREQGIVRRADLSHIIQSHFFAPKLPPPDFDLQTPCLIFFVGVNGAGKTSTIAKMIYWLTHARTLSPAQIGVIGADTFRAAAMDQLRLRLAGLPVTVYAPQKTAKPATALYEGISHCHAQSVLLVDTSGRMHTNAQLTAELAAMIEKGTKWFQDKRAHSKTYVVLVADATHGHSLGSQINVFGSKISIHSLLLSKFDCLHSIGPIIAQSALAPYPVFAYGLGENNEHIQRVTDSTWADLLAE